MPKLAYTCDNCTKVVYKYPSQVHGARFYCSKDCKHIGQSIHYSGANNSNFKTGVHCTPSVCECGGIKDYRSSQCNRCKANIQRYFAKGTTKRNGILWKYIKTFDLLSHDNCAWCGLGPEWNGKPLVLQLDHIDGDTSNNDLTNLRVLCPNCHSQTDTFTSKNRSRK